MRVSRLSSLLLFVGIVFMACSGGSRDTTSMEGHWEPLMAQMGGIELPEKVRNSIKLSVENGQYTVLAGETVDKGTVTLNTTVQPMTADITGTDGPNKGRTMLAIYERMGDTLRICYDLTGTQRPTQFATEAGTQQLLVTYVRRTS